MKFTCTKENLANVLGLTSSLASKQSHLPILQNILINATDSKVEMLATNLEMAVHASLRAKVDEKGSFTVPAKTLADYVNLLPEEQVEVSLVENELVVSCGSSSTKIKGSPADEYPVMPEVEDINTYTIEVTRLRDGLSKTVVAAAKNEIRPELSGVYAGFFTERFGGLVLAATDSYRLAEANVVVAQGDKEIKAIIPSRTVYEMVRLLSLAKGSDAETQVRLFVSENQIAMRYGNFEMTSRLVDGNYPDYVQIIPAEFKTTSVVPLDILTKKIKAAALFTTTGVNAVSFDLNSSDKTLGVSSTSTQTGAHDSKIDAEVTGEENSILLNHRYVLEGLAQLDEEVEFRVNSSDAPCLFAGKGNKDYLYIVMPIRQ
jgi:DNA polymerase III subunit beta